MEINKYTWQQEKQMLEDSFARSLLVEHNIKEVTTQRQAIARTSSSDSDHVERSCISSLTVIVSLSS